ncbi:glutaredoxin family protein [Psychrobacter sp. TAE2020]|uniref:glutaredoxin family protein n=1 Tax=Psychrobacter sp. TAE2020 TaxID=2846762 RepID=UPI001C107E1D|nr:glutaredoxin family protein [Psychrobacter sp. TAE2020]MBU5617807.1 glutaredoxin family protein [Psychrobacter sp. TAE2020]
MNYPDPMQALRAAIIEATPKLNQPELYQQWWLLGTSGCHLCDDAENILMRLQSVQPLSYQNIDIADFDETLMLSFATSIPVLLTVNKRLDWPFSVLDLQQLLSEY